MKREILLVPHASRADNLEATIRAAEILQDAGIKVRVSAAEHVLPNLQHVEHTPAAAAGCELVLVLGGDGTFLRAADMARAWTFQCWASTSGTLDSSLSGKQNR